MQKNKIVSVILISLIITSFLSVQNANGYVDASCHVSVQITARPSAIQIKGQTFTRQNPDGTYYPGDAFDFAILVSWTQNCWYLYPQPIKSGGLTVSNIQQGPTSCSEDGCSYPEYGHAEIATTASSAYVSQTVEAFGLVCDIFKCSKGYTSGSGYYSPTIIEPQVTVALKFENLTDKDGYKMRNEDGTYYVWDGINIVFDPNYKWKMERFGTIDTHTDSSSDISLIGQYECHKRSCPYTFSVPAIDTWNYNFEYEEGHTAYNSTSLGDIHRHLFQYDTTVYNLGRKIGEGSNSTTALVVQYDPVYVNYPYTVLKDISSWWGFGKSPAVALHYYGSIGGGQDDGSAVIHPDRRSKINSFEYTSFAYRITTPMPLNESMTWQASYPANFIDGNFTYHDNSLQSGKNSAMFVHAGYGKIVFTDPILYPILKTRYDNSTIINQLQSANFAGFGIYNLTRYHFSYPHTRFSTDVIVIALHSDGSINYLPLSLKMVPDFAENATYEQDFIREKVTHDRDRIFAGIVLDDMYGMQDNATGSGVVNMRANLTSMVIPNVYKVFAQDPLDLPLNLVYEQPSPYNVTITAGQKQLSFIERGFEFDTNWRYVINTDQDNILNATRFQGLIDIYPDNNFGPYSQILIDGKAQNFTCNSGCTILLPDRNANATIVAYNIWGGKASKTFEYLNLVAKQTSDYDTIVTAVLIILVSVIGYGFARRYWRSFAGALGFSND
ncbi:MAG: hypothetical protein KGH88_08640 [Thaumarchaeota archaeon]|nr:hypothetical protein [Nitrososphaerota archaeon]